MHRSYRGEGVGGEIERLCTSQGNTRTIDPASDQYRSRPERRRSLLRASNCHVGPTQGGRKRKLVGRHCENLCTRLGSSSNAFTARNQDQKIARVGQQSRGVEDTRSVHLSAAERGRIG